MYSQYTPSPLLLPLPVRPPLIPSWPLASLFFFCFFFEAFACDFSFIYFNLEYTKVHKDQSILIFFVPILQLPVPIFLSERPGGPPVKSNEQSEPLEGNGLKSHLEMARDENGETEDWGRNGAADTEDDGEGGDQSHLWIQGLKTSLNEFVC